MVKLRGPSSYDTTILHTFLPLLERFLRCLPKTLRDKFQYPVPAEAKLGPAQLNPQYARTLSQNNKAGKIMYKR